MILTSALSCFLQEKLSSGVIPVYDSNLIPVIAKGGNVEHYWPEDSKSSFVHVPMEIQQTNLEDLAWRVLLNASLMHSRIRICDVESLAPDLIRYHLFGFIVKNDTMLAIANPEYFSRHPICGNEEGLLVYNSRGVIRIESTIEETIAYDVMLQ
jgi:hypothetical protein